MTIIRLFTLCLALLACPTVAFAQFPSCFQFFPGGRPPALVNPKLTQRATLLCNDAFAVLASGVTHGALWSAEHPTAASVGAARGTPRQGEFHPDERLPPEDRAELDDYRQSGYDRGHMTPSGDMPDERAQQQSFSLANMVPQAGELNRGLWAGIEMATRELAASEGELYLVTGPAFLGQRIDSIGPHGVLVPTSTWKAVFDPRANQTGVYVCTNTATPSCSVVSVAVLARTVGIDPFPALPARLKQVAMTLPQPEKGRYATTGQRRRGREPRGFLEQLFGNQERR